MTGREPAWRIFAQELAAATEEERGSGERAASYVITPIGARANRVLMAGRIGPLESMGRDPSAPFFRASLTDPTGPITLTAGGFQPKALGALQRQRPDDLVLVVGKATMFRPRDGAPSPSVRAEALRRIDHGEYRRWLSETLDHTVRRAQLVRSVHRGEHPVAGAGVPDLWIAGARASAHRYPTNPGPGLRSGLVRVVEELEDRARPSPPSPATPRPETPSPEATRAVRVTRTTPPVKTPAPPSAAGRAEEAAFLDVVDELADASPDGYADLKEAIGLAGRRGLSPARAEEILNALEENGALEEPLVGKIRRA